MVFVQKKYFFIFVTIAQKASCANKTVKYKFKQKLVFHRRINEKSAKKFFRPLFICVKIRDKIEL